LSLSGQRLPAGSYFVELLGLPEGNRKTIQLLKMKR
jgi:hypothetical protein